MFDALVLAGGGCRCFWQVGFLEALRERHDFMPRYVSCVSAGSAMATMLFSGALDRGLESFERRVGENASNAYPANVLTSAPVFPHLAMYSATLRDALDAAAIARLSEAPPIDVLIARSPKRLPPLAALTVGFGAYMLERRLRNGIHPSWPRALGYTPELIRVQDVLAEHPDNVPAAAEAVIDLVLASSCTPPLTPLLRYRGRIALDGGLVDNVPVFAVPPDAERVLVLLTRTHHPKQLHGDRRMQIVQPSRSTPITKWDYTNPELFRQTLELGRRDGEHFARQLSTGRIRMRPRALGARIGLSTVSRINT